RLGTPSSSSTAFAACFPSRNSAFLGGSLASLEERVCRGSFEPLPKVQIRWRQSLLKPPNKLRLLANAGSRQTSTTFRPALIVEDQAALRTSAPAVSSHHPLSRSMYWPMAVATRLSRRLLAIPYNVASPTRSLASPTARE